MLESDEYCDCRVVNATTAAQKPSDPDSKMEAVSRVPSTHTVSCSLASDGSHMLEKSTASLSQIEDNQNGAVDDVVVL